MAGAREFFDLTMETLTRDPWYTVRGPEADPLRAEEERIGSEPPAVELPAEATMRQMVDALWRLPRHIVSDGYDAALRALATQVPMTIHEYPSGTEAWTWIEPE